MNAKRFVVMSASNDNGWAVIVDSLDAAADYIRKEREKDDPPFDAESIASQDQEIMQMLNSGWGEDGTHTISGNPAWKQSFYVAVLEEPTSTPAPKT